VMAVLEEGVVAAATREVDVGAGGEPSKIVS
jgi:hypothetical protein